MLSSLPNRRVSPSPPPRRRRHDLSFAIIFPAFLFSWMFLIVGRSRLPSSFPRAVQAFAFSIRRPSFVTTTTTRRSRSKSSRLKSTLTGSSTTTTPTTTTTSSSTTTTNNMTDTTAQQRMKEYPLEMTDAEKYLFDLNGYLIVRGVLSPEEVQEANNVIDRHAHEMVERSDTALRNTVGGTQFAGTGPGRMDLGRCLEWDGTESNIFKSILAHPRLVPIFHGILGKGYRMDHLPMILAQNKGSEGFQLHGGTIDCTTGEYNPHLAYHYHHGTIRSALLGCNVILVDHNAGDGGFCIVPGSHKSNFKMPQGMVDGELYEEYIIQPPTKAGDVILFSEGTVHGAKAWMSDKQRRTALFRFAPATNAYGRSYFGHNSNDGLDGNASKGGWPSGMYESLTPAQRAVLEPPYANRLDRPNIDNAMEGTVVLTTRSARKRQHDQDVFGTKYF